MPFPPSSSFVRAITTLPLRGGKMLCVRLSVCENCVSEWGEDFCVSVIALKTGEEEEEEEEEAALHTQTVPQFSLLSD